MCGLFGHSMRVGYMENFTAHQLVAMNAILATSMDRRGGDGWGHADFGTSYWEAPAIYKGLDYITPQITKTLTYPTQYRIGHTRKKTHGAASIRNSHPFTTGSIVGAHNGVINNHIDIARELEVQVEVDSEVIFHAIDKKFDMSRISGYGAITYADMNNPGIVYMGRFNSGQLSVWGVGENKDRPNMVIWASTRDAIETALAAAGLVGFPYAIDDGKLYYAQGGKLFTHNEEIPISSAYKVTNRMHYCGAGGAVTDKEWRHYWDEMYTPSSREIAVRDALTTTIDVTEYDDTALPGGDKKKDSVLESGLDGDLTLTQLWAKYAECTIDFPTFLAAASEAQCETCPGGESWYWFDIASNLFLCSYCAIETEVDVEESLNVRDVKRLAWSYAQQQAATSLKGGWKQTP